MSWNPYIDDLPEDEPGLTGFLPSSLKEYLVLDDPGLCPPPGRREGSDHPLSESPSIASPAMKFYSVRFHASRCDTVASATQFNDGDFVVTDADRGIGIGQILCQVPMQRIKNPMDIKLIVRKATADEIAGIPVKEEREKCAMLVCREKVQELALQMEITGAEFQFDGKKLTIYYSAHAYVDFRDLVKGLFRVFGTRIWMVWHDGKAPVKNVYSRGMRQK
jgi:hypothetical protein